MGRYLNLIPWPNFIFRAYNFWSLTEIPEFWFAYQISYRKLKKFTMLKNYCFKYPNLKFVGDSQSNNRRFAISSVFSSLLKFYPFHAGVYGAFIVLVWVLLSIETDFSAILCPSSATSLNKKRWMLLPLNCFPVFHVLSSVYVRTVSRT